MFETPSTKSIKKIFTNILKGSDNNPKFSDMLAKHTVGDLKYNSMQILEMLRVLKKYLRDGLMKVDDDSNFIGIKNFMKLYNIDLNEAKNFSALERCLYSASETFAKELQENIDVVLIENIRMRNSTTINDSKVISMRELNKALLIAIRQFKYDLVTDFSEYIEDNDNFETTETVKISETA